MAPCFRPNPLTNPSPMFPVPLMPLHHRDLQDVLLQGPRQPNHPVSLPDDAFFGDDLLGDHLDDLCRACLRLDTELFGARSRRTLKVFSALAVF